MQRNVFRYRPAKRIAIAAFVVVLIASVLRYFVQGIVLPVRIGSGSMAPALLGPHYEQTCADCGFRWPFETQAPADFSRLVCPNCGALHACEPTPLLRGDRVLIDRWSYVWAEPRRGDIVVYHLPQDRSQWAVKRILGLPGEQITLREGDLYANGQIVRKSLAELRGVALLVHDARHAPQSPDMPARWAREESTSTTEPNWISFRAWRCFDSPLPRTAETRVLDNDGYNQGLSRATHEVYDLLLRCRVVFSGAGRVHFRGHDGLAEYQVEINQPRGQVRLSRAGQVLVDQRLPAAVGRSAEAEYEFALVDRQIFLAIDGRVVLEHPIDDADGAARRAALRPLAYATSDPAIRVTDQRVYRDLHYLGPLPFAKAWHGPKLAANTYFLLGDNVPLSVDSRYEPSAVTRKHLIGKALRLR